MTENATAEVNRLREVIYAALDRLVEGDVTGATEILIAEDQ